MTLMQINVQVRKPIDNNRLCNEAIPHFDAYIMYGGHLPCKDSTYACISFCLSSDQQRAREAEVNAQDRNHLSK